MNRIDRLTGILLTLQGSPRTARQLADRFEVSRRTILRDIDALCQMQIPIVALPGPNGGYRLPDDYTLPPLHLTGEEATILLLGLSSLGLPERSALGAAHHVVQDKLLATMRGDVKTQAQENLKHLAVVTNHDGTIEATVRAIREATLTESWLEVEYRGQREITTRSILPRLVYLANSRWYVQAVDALRSASRVFRVSRIESVRNVAPPQHASAIVQSAEHADDAYHHRDNPEIDVVLTKRGTELALDHPDLLSHVAISGDRGMLRFHCPESELPYYARELLRFEMEAVVIGPPALRRHMLTTIEHLRRHLQNSDSQVSPFAS
jgi:predicted DNA-binding transcriptional regulator YafY